MDVHNVITGGVFGSPVIQVGVVSENKSTAGKHFPESSHRQFPEDVASALATDGEAVRLSRGEYAAVIAVLQHFSTASSPEGETVQLLASRLEGR
ncbi:hypothetical protein [Kitasatospora cineracea]|uniref:hypothetical protein n=1 Tax=Kitasatospora cineracea TaxID=88074 RepID=UPI000F46E990|nr:hypothetical protein [Kitasatospora cineracea]